MVGKWKLRTNVLLGIFSGLCNFLFINLVTRIIGLIVAGDLTVISKEYIIIFSFIILVFVWTRRTLSLTIIKLSQKLFWNLRKQIISLVLKANYQQLAKRKNKIYAAIVNDVDVLTQTSMTIIDFFTSLILAVSCLIYMATISWLLLAITLGITALGIIVYQLGSKKNMEDFEKARSLEDKFLNDFNSILSGFKEIYMEPKKGKSLYDNKVMPVARQAYRNNTAAFTGFMNNQVVGRVLFYVLISAILLVFSIKLHIKASETVSFVFTLLYLLGAVEMIMALLPGLMRARVSTNRLMDLTAELEGANFNNPIPQKYISKNEFARVEVKDLEFYYEENENSFGIGPVNFSINKSEVAFIYGGNGSGKTTFVHAILGLLVPSAGEIRLNGVPVDHANYPDYRTAFSVVFSDFYLFNELLGTDHFNLEKWNYYLQLFELEGKVKLEGTSFSTTELSTGQRKRLALIAALLEEKPVLIIDEWAADQDPYFRRKFYTEIIPALKNEGITIIAITHDDKYYHCADKLYKMDSGKLIEENVNMHEPSYIA
jgi:putative ATP-binding cassette transporter